MVIYETQDLNFVRIIWQDEIFGYERMGAELVIRYGHAEKKTQNDKTQPVDGAITPKSTRKK